MAPHGVRGAREPGNPGRREEARSYRPLNDPAPITPERMLGEARHAGVIYRSNAVHPRHQANLRVFAPLDLQAEVSAHIPDPHEKTTLFHGWFSNRTRGYRKEHGLLGDARLGEPAPGGDARAPPLLGPPHPPGLRGGAARMSRLRREHERPRRH